MQEKNLFLKDHTDRLFLVISILSFGALALALVSQHEFDMQPCAWCVMQRIILVVGGILGLLFACFPSTIIKKLGFVTLLAVNISGLVAATYQYLVAAKTNSCGVSFAENFIFQSGLGELLPSVFGVLALCNESNPTVLGIPYVILSLVLFLTLIFLLVKGFLKLLRRNR